MNELLSTPLSVISSWKKMFNPANLSTESVKKALNLHYELASDKTDEELEFHFSNIETMDLKKTDLLICNLTLFHIAIIKKRVKIVKIFLAKAKVEDLDINDFFGWSPLFHSVCHQEIHQLLLEKNFKRSGKTQMGGDFQKLQFLMGKTFNTFSKGLISFQVGQRKRKLEELSAEEFKKLTGITHYHDGPIHSEVEELWSGSLNPRSDPIMEARIRAYKVWNKSPIALTLSKSGSKEFKLKVDVMVEVGKVIGEVGGVVTQKRSFKKDSSIGQELKTSRDSHIYKFLDTSLVGNPIPLSVKGFPNVMLKEISCEGSQRVIAIAVENLKTGDTVVYDNDYGSYVAFDCQKNYRNEEMREYFKTSLENRYKEAFEHLGQFPEKCSEVNPALKKNIQERLLQIKDKFALGTDAELMRVVFCFRNPGVLMDLIFSETVKISDLLSTLNSLLLNKIFIKHFFNELGYLLWNKAFLKELLTYQLTFNKYPQIKSKIYSWVVQSIGIYANMAIFKTLSQISIRLKEKESLSDQEIEQIIEEFKAYQWLEDLDFPVPLHKPWVQWIEEADEKIKKILPIKLTSPAKALDD